MAMQILLTSLLGSAGAIYSDQLEFNYPNRGRIYLLMASMILATLSFEIHGLVQFIYDGDSRDHPMAYILHFVARMLYAVFTAIYFPVIDGITLSFLESHGEEGESMSDFGRERLLGAVSWAIASTIIGPVIDRFGFGAFFWSAPIGGLLCIITYQKYASDLIEGEKFKSLPRNTDDDHDESLKNMNIDTSEGINEGATESESESESSKNVNSMTLLTSMLSSYTAIGYVVCSFTLFMGTGVVEYLIFLYFDDLGGSNTICGLTVAVTVLFEIPIFYYAPKLLELYGAENLQKIACFAYITRVMGYTFVPKNHVALVLLLEPLHGVTYACNKTSSVEFAARITPKGYEASGQGLITLILLLGQVAGLSLGGWIEDDFGPVVLYRVFAGIVGTGLLLFYMATAIDGRTKTTYRQLQ